MDTNILLESGTNELEVLEFTLWNSGFIMIFFAERMFYNRADRFNFRFTL